MHLRSTHHRYASHLELLGDLEGAIRHFEAAGTEAAEVPRLLLAAGDTARLERYVEARPGCSRAV